MEGAGEWLRDRRISAKMTQDELAGKLHVTRQTISSWEMGRTSINGENLSRIKCVFSDVAVDCGYSNNSKESEVYQKFQKKYIIFCVVDGALLLVLFVAYAIVKYKLGNASELHGLGMLSMLFWYKLALGSMMSLLLGFLVPNLIAMYKKVCLPNALRIAVLLLDACVLLIMFWIVGGYFFGIMLPPIGSELWSFFRLLLKGFHSLRLVLPFLFGVLTFFAFNKNAHIKE